MKKGWVVYGCELVDLADMGIEDVGVKRAIRIRRDDVRATAVGLPRGFTTKVLLDYDFSDDGQVVSFVGEYGPVMCPYGGAIERTFAAIEEPVAYRRLLYSISYGSDDEKEGDSPGFFARLFGRVRRREGPGPLDESEGFGGCDAMWDGKRVFYMGLQGSAESEYARAEQVGFLRYLEGDDKLVGTERVRAAAMNEAARKHQADGEWAYPDCLIALEEVRSVLYLLQVSAIVMQGLSFIDGSLDERRNAGIQRNRYRSALLPKVDVEECSEEDRRQASQAEDGAERVADLQKDIRLFERLFGLFIEGRPNIIKAFKAVRDSCLVSMDRDPELLGMPDGIFSEAEQRAIGRRLEDAYAACGEDDDETKALLGLRPLWRAWDGLIDDAALFLNACLTSCWSVGGHRLIETPALRVGEYADGGAYFAQGTGRMTLQRAIAEQVVSNLDFAYERLHEPAGSKKKEPVWQICECCGLPFIFRSTSRKLVLEGTEGRPTRKKLPSATTCSDACRMRMTRANG